MTYKKVLNNFNILNINNMLNGNLYMTSTKQYHMSVILLTQSDSHRLLIQFLKIIVIACLVTGQL